MVESFFLAVTRTPSNGPSCPITCPDSPGSALAVTAPRLEAASATARLAAVDNSTYFIRIMITPWYVFSKTASWSLIAVHVARMERTAIRDKLRRSAVPDYATEDGRLIRATESLLGIL